MAMLRTTALRSLFRTLAASSTATKAPLQQQLRSQLCTLSARRASPAAPKTLSLVRRYAEERKFVDQIDQKAEDALKGASIKPHPELVSTTSSVRPGLSSTELDDASRGHRDDDQTEMLAGVKGDLVSMLYASAHLGKAKGWRLGSGFNELTCHTAQKTIRDTFSMADVPKPAFYVGLAGVLPYLATSLSTVYCAWEINHSYASGSGLLINEKTAELALHVIEPLQIGYGAVIISFLGAIHWGLEFAGYKGYHGFGRYNIGVITTALAWPTILLPIESALIAQFLIFNFLYYTDSRATKRGWAPSWYAVYRFALTFVVGASIVTTLIGRGQLPHDVAKSHGVAEKIRQLRESQGQELEEEEEARIRFLGSKDEEEDEEEEGDDEE
ncbi:Protein of unknown function (DUF3429) [Teratosphaeria destructans]|uniref:Mitochondrial inner membrane protein 1 n=1 Tax=Teratosphaeria destructans TaxID=418781 RepID=A0A9W7SXU0_9PEZI|nr:Protein of unknown function (DUF3429) [Teratosphaeria destructans]